MHKYADNQAQRSPMNGFHRLHANLENRSFHVWHVRSLKDGGGQNCHMLNKKIQTGNDGARAAIWAACAELYRACATGWLVFQSGFLQ